MLATDTFVRYPTSLALNSKVIVLLEHVLGLILILPWLLVKHRDDILQVKEKTHSIDSHRGSRWFRFGESFLYEKHSVHRSLLIDSLSNASTHVGRGSGVLLFERAP